MQHAEHLQQTAPVYNFLAGGTASEKVRYNHDTRGLRLPLSPKLVAAAAEAAARILRNGRARAYTLAVWCGRCINVTLRGQLAQALESYTHEHGSPSVPVHGTLGCERPSCFATPRPRCRAHTRNCRHAQTCAKKLPPTSAAATVRHAQLNECRIPRRKLQLSPSTIKLR